ncbi:hypothetical protein B0J11DRAFT_139909 [Dendryphion nanum]|uniref:Uncharacterized protein n=1 Tax=Dendryphion nanum TaxID=256645 RepID=A0A9P9D6T5_9PLEO|nr:hypothetical protein B0J11DRAFT_139909 [Dendryphion nanum]
MPHKHKRKAENDDSHYNLPPSARAAPLPVTTSRHGAPLTANFAKTRTSKKRKVANIQGYGADDTPKAFARLMAFKTSGGKRRSGLDDGISKTKKQRKEQEREKKQASEKQTSSNSKLTEKEGNNVSGEQGDDVVDSEAQPVAPVLKIQPGERLSEFNSRVNQALPLSGISKASNKKIPGMGPDHRVTKHEKKLKRLQAGWRKEEARIRDKEDEERELAEEDEDEMDAMWENKTAEPLRAVGKKKGGKKNKRKRVVGEVDDKEDAWDELQKRKIGERKGMHDVVQEPPSFDKVPREIFKVKNLGGAKVDVGNVPKGVGSLARREELGRERVGIIETYRQLMKGKRGDA